MKLSLNWDIKEKKSFCKFISDKRYSMENVALLWWPLIFFDLLSSWTFSKDHLLKDPQKVKRMVMYVFWHYSLTFSSFLSDLVCFLTSSSLFPSLTLSPLLWLPLFIFNLLNSLVAFSSLSPLLWVCICMSGLHSVWPSLAFSELSRSSRYILTSFEPLWPFVAFFAFHGSSWTFLFFLFLDFFSTHPSHLPSNLSSSF